MPLSKHGKLPLLGLCAGLLVLPPSQGQARDGPSHRPQPRYRLDQNSNVMPSPTWRSRSGAALTPYDSVTSACSGQRR